MTGERHSDRAVKAVRDFFQPTAIGDGSGLELWLREYETTTSQESGTIPNPIAYYAAFAPSDTRSPLVLIYDRAIRPAQAGMRNRLMEVEIDIGVLYTHDSDLEDGETIARSYVSAMIRAVQEDPTLGGRVVGAIFTEADRTLAVQQQNSRIRHVRVVGLTIHVHDQ